MVDLSRIVLVNPAQVVESGMGIDVRQKSWPPLGLLHLGEILRREGHEVKIFDQDVLGYSPNETLNWIKRKDPEILGLSPLAVALEPALQIAKLAKNWNENLVTVFGNILATLVYRNLLKNYDYIDYCFQGEAENTISKFVQTVEQGGGMRAVEGLCYRENGIIKSNPPPPLNRNLDTIPFPDREELIDFDYRMGSNKFTVLASSRGCPFQCKFCTAHCVPNSRGIWRSRSIENIINELHYLQSRGYEEFSFVDDNFIVDQKRTINLCQQMKYEKIDMIWSCEGRVDKGSSEVLQTMQSANCYSLILGLESANQRILDYYNKQITPEMSKKVVKKARKAKINIITGLFIVGAPDETIQEIINTLKFGMKLDLDFAVYQPLYVYLGSEIWKEALSHGLIDEERTWNKSKIFAADIFPTAVKHDILEKLITNGFIEFLSRPKYLLKEVIRTISNPGRLQIIFKMIKKTSK